MARSGATLLKSITDPESHLFTSNLLFMITELGVDGERVLAVFSIPEFGQSSPSHNKAECAVEAALSHDSSERLFARQGGGDEDADRHVAVDGKGRSWRLAPQDFIAFRDLARAAEAEIGEVASYTVASGEDCTPVLFFVYPVSPSLNSLSSNAVSRAAIVDPVHRDMHGDTTGNAREGYVLLRDVDVNAYARFCRKLARTQSSSINGEEPADMPGELPGALHELLGLAQEWPEDCETDDETENGLDEVELLRATVARVARIRSSASELRVSD